MLDIHQSTYYIGAETESFKWPPDFQTGEHLAKPSEGVSSDTLATLLIITTGWKYNSLGLVQ